jgi:hypothetical protein
MPYTPPDPGAKGVVSTSACQGENIMQSNAQGGIDCVPCRFGTTVNRTGSMDRCSLNSTGWTLLAAAAIAISAVGWAIFGHRKH